MSKDPSVKWYHHPANSSELDLLADIIRYQAERLAKPHVEPQRADTATMQRMVDRMHDTITRDMGVAG